MADLDDELVGQSSAIEAVRSDLRRLLGLAREGRRLPAVLIEGETGTGKGLVARLLHRNGPRARGPFIDVNCAAIPETLLEAELFGYERGAFTDARHGKPGLFQTSSGGVLFLDEVGLLPLSLQAKLLTVIEEQAVRRLGGTAKETFDSWLISATNADLEIAVHERRFREDLYHRLAVLTLRLPPLRARAGDAVLLAQRLLERACRHYGVPAKSLTPGARSSIAADPWPGNVRELANVVERLALLADGRDITGADLELARGGRPAPAAGRPVAPPRGDERQEIVAALEATGWNIMRTAARLGVSRNTVRARMDRLGLRAGRASGAPAPIEIPAERPVPPGVAPPPPALPAIGVVRWERRHVTLVRVALTGTSDGGPLLSLAAEKIAGFGGRIEGLGRGSLHASFGAAPIESATRRAIGAALAINRAVAEGGPSDLTATIVAHTEQATVADLAGAPMIDDVHRASLAGVLDRLAARVEPGAVHVSAATAPFVDRHFELRASAAAAGSAERWFTVVGRDPTGLGEWRRLTRFFGRQTEIDLLRARWDLARQGRGQVVGVVGEPGCGKSRLLLEFVRAVDPDSALVIRVAVSATEDRSRSRPAAALVGALFSIEPGDGPAEVRQKLAEHLRHLDLEAGVLPALAALLDVDVGDRGWAEADPQQRARRMLDALRRVLARESVARTVVIILEDLHWVDADTRAALDRLIDVVPTARIFFAVTYRPECRHGWASKTFYTQLRVDPLPVGAAGELLDDLLGPAPDLAALKQQLLAWTEGNPFFLEEAVRTLVETGGLVGAQGAYRAAGEVVVHTLPATVEDTVASRIHRLPAGVRHVLQCAAAIGADFAPAVLVPLADLPEEATAEALRVLEEAEFVYPVVGPGESTFTFRHALTHLVAYRSLPADHVRILHARVLPVLESLHAADLDAHVETLAEHAFCGQAWDRAAAYLHASGTRALARSATRTAVHHLERARTAVDRAGPERGMRARAIDIRLDLRYALVLLGRPEQTVPHLREAEAIAVELDDGPRLGRVVSFLANGMYNLGDHAGAIASARRAREISERLGDFATRVTADIYAGRALHALGRFREATETFHVVVAALHGERATDYAGLPVLPAAYARSYLVMGLTELGDFAEARAIGEEAMAIAEDTAHPDTIQWACYALGLTALGRGDVNAAIPSLERALSICREAELPVYVARAAAALGHACALAGRADALALLETAAAESAGASHRNIQARVLARLAESCAIAGKAQEAVDAARRAIALAREYGERGSESHALRTLAMACAAALRPEEARVAFEDARALAVELGMRPLAALCHLGMGKLARAGGRRDDAHRHLTIAHEAFRDLGTSEWEREAAAERGLLD